MIIVQNERIILIGGVKQPPGKQEFTALWPCQSNQGQHSIVYMDNNSSDSDKVRLITATLHPIGFVATAFIVWYDEITLAV